MFKRKARLFKGKPQSNYFETCELEGHRSYIADTFGPSLNFYADGKEIKVGEVMELSDKASYIREKILERDIESCKDISPEQMETISRLATEYYDVKESDNERIRTICYQCLCCGHQDHVPSKRKEYQEVKVCPKCNGAFVDRFKNALYTQGVNTLSKLNVQIDGKAVAKEVKEVIKKQIDKLNEDKLLVIELENESSVPKVFYEGEEIEGRIHINFEWKTKGDHNEIGGMHFLVEHYDKDTQAVHIKSRKTGEFM